MSITSQPIAQASSANHALSSLGSRVDLQASTLACVLAVQSCHYHEPLLVIPGTSGQRYDMIFAADLYAIVINAMIGGVLQQLFKCGIRWIGI